MKRAIFVTLLFAALPCSLTAQRYTSDNGETRVALVKMPYSGARNVAELSGGPTYLEAGGRPTNPDERRRAVEAHFQRRAHGRGGASVR